MKFLRESALVIAMIFCAASFSFAAGWDTCKGCHTDSGKPASSKATFLKKFKTSDDLITAAKAAKSPMMNNFKKDDQLKAAAKDLGLK